MAYVESRKWKKDSTGLRILPHWISQPYIRPELPNNGHHAKKVKLTHEKSENSVSALKAADENKENISSI
jgi:hypothetical protein